MSSKVRIFNNSDPTACTTLTASYHLVLKRGLKTVTIGTEIGLFCMGYSVMYGIINQRTKTKYIEPEFDQALRVKQQFLT